MASIELTRNLIR